MQLYHKGIQFSYVGAGLFLFDEVFENLLKGDDSYFNLNVASHTLLLSSFAVCDIAREFFQ